ncbi:diaminopimelate decarboxylase [Niallia circulans]|uniref:diaminopimelate decarboxylase n=1 Tax=Shouchella clausii TaxID=79880 RepID=UPI000BA5D1E3|nr:diaminopimelate decarboxylase [Shouchella clausii]MCM3547767.1 diaminopimelate decarboxylase [Shouchella clausii]PAF12007.1 diaminopimelate decarboxylase [Shouchella clausii]SPU21835.1 diaminopimelate decarboxylase [Niallia circulans]
MYLHGTMTINEAGHLEIGGVDTVDLAKKYDTPLFVYDTALIKDRAHAFKQAFEAEGVSYQVAYASKAFSCIAMYQLAASLDLSIDVVSGGELFTALKAGVEPGRIHFHGNNKSRGELEMAIKAGIGCIVADNFYELELLEQLAANMERTVSILLRLTPGVEAHTHEFIATGQEDSKFGFDIASGQADKAARIAERSKFIDLLGVHSHIGSQIFETEGFVLAIEKVFNQLQGWQEEFDFVPRVLNFGGGFGIRYVEGDKPLEPETYIREIVKETKKHADRLGLAIPEIWIEPGRSLVGDAATTLYTIGSTKDIPNVRRYLSVDGGMSDNLRPALYDAKYEGLLANRAHDKAEETFSVAGKCCESGDMLVWDMPLPEVQHGDVLAMFCTGAYGYSMANNYNRIPRPAVVFVEDGADQLVIQRESYEDLTKLDLSYQANVKETSDV